MTRFQIDANLHQALSQARKLEEAASLLDRQVVIKLDSVANAVHASWKSESAANYLNKEQILQQKIKATAVEMRNIAYDIRTVANRIAAAEREALRIATERR